MNPRVLKVIAIAWAVGLLGTYVAYRYKQSRPSSQHIMPSSKLGKVHLTSEPYSTSMPSTDLRTFVGTKSAAVFHQADVESAPTATPPPNTQPQLLPGSKSFTGTPIVKPGDLQLMPSSKSGRLDLLPGSKSAPVDFIESPPPETRPATQEVKPPETPPGARRMLLPGSKSSNHAIDNANILFSDEPAAPATSQPTTAPADPKP